jgi:hypothetical protein
MEPLRGSNPIELDSYNKPRSGFINNRQEIANRIRTPEGFH